MFGTYTQTDLKPGLGKATLAVDFASLAVEFAREVCVPVRVCAAGLDQCCIQSDLSGSKLKMHTS